MIDKKEIQEDDARIISILDFITKLAGGDLSARLPASGKNDELDGVIVGLNMLAEELSFRLISFSEAEKRLDEIMEIIVAIASLDYSKKMAISDRCDTFDAIASGLNALGEELHASTVSKDYLDKIIQSMSDILLVCSPDTKIRKVNQAALDLLGYTEMEVLDQPLEIVFEPAAFKAIDFTNRLEAGSIKNWESTFLTKDGKEIIVSFSASVMKGERGEDGQSDGIVCVAHDITERKMLEKERLMRQERLAQLGQLAGGIGHELRNPLGAIKNSVYFLNMVLENTDPEVKETLDILNKEVVTSERIISSLLDFARAKPPLKRKVSLETTIKETLSRIDVPENVTIKTEINESIHMIMGDPYQLNQVFGNIILNAIQAMPEGGSLNIGASMADEEKVSISFTDSGVGIPPENIDKIFTPLFTSKAKGIGLGMAITRTFIEGHGGTIEVQSEKGKGSTFTIKLPIRE